MVLEMEDILLLLTTIYWLMDQIIMVLIIVQEEEDIEEENTEEEEEEEVKVVKVVRKNTNININIIVEEEDVEEEVLQVLIKRIINFKNIFFLKELIINSFKFFNLNVSGREKKSCKQFFFYQY